MRRVVVVCCPAMLLAAGCLNLSSSGYDNSGGDYDNSGDDSFGSDAGSSPGSFSGPRFGGFGSGGLPNIGALLGSGGPGLDAHFADTRPVVTAPAPPPPISGGTLLITHDGTRAVAADPDRDRVSIVGLSERAVLATIMLKPGDEPGRVVEDDEGRVHVALRRGGAVASIDLASRTLLRRTAVCGAPRGIAYDTGAKNLYVVCAGGDVVTLPAAGGGATRVAVLDPDLRDVVVTPDGLVVSRFKSAALLELGTDGKLVRSISPKGIDRLSDAPNGGTVSERVEPALAFRLLPSPEGIRVLHQYDSTKIIDVSPSQTGLPTMPYGALGGGCGGLVQPAVSISTRHELSMGAPIQAPVLAVDAAISPDGKWLALVHAGMNDPGAPSISFFATAKGLGRISILAADVSAGESGPVGCVAPSSVVDVAGQTTAVAFNPDVLRRGAALVVQTREPAQLVVLSSPTATSGETIALGGVSMLDTGHELFHRDTGIGIACASCHPEGAEDGRVWRFAPTGDRRTQAVNVGIAGTEPFHWDGDVDDLGSLMVQVFEHRMGGPHESPERVDSLARWLDTVEPPARIVASTSPEAERGRTLFESTGCIGCHSGEKHTSNANAWVGTTEAGHVLQIPSLVGVGYRQPFLHDGRAATLRGRFDPTYGGGDAHGTTSNLSDAELDDLISYLESL